MKTVPHLKQSGHNLFSGVGSLSEKDCIMPETEKLSVKHTKKEGKKEKSYQRKYRTGKRVLLKSEKNTTKFCEL